MYSRQQKSIAKAALYTAFGQYMKPVPAMEREAVNWLNYKSGVKGIYLRTDVLENTARVGIEITLLDPQIRNRVFDELFFLRSYLRNLETGKAWLWLRETVDDQGRVIGLVYSELGSVNYMNQQDWPSIISFFKAGMMALDAYWTMAQAVVETVIAS